MRYLSLLTLVLLCATKSIAQCTIPTYPPQKTYVKGEYANLAGKTYNTGDTVVFANTANPSVSGVTLKGGVLYVYNTLTLGSSSASSGGGISYIIIMPGVNVTFLASMHLNSNVVIINYGNLTIQGGLTTIDNVNIINVGGTITINGSISLGTNSSLINATTTSTIIVNIGNSGSVSGNIVNNGNIYFNTDDETGTTTIKNSASICLGAGSSTTFSGNVVDSAYFNVSPAGSVAGLSVGGNLVVKGSSLTQTTGLRLCLGSSSSTVTGPVTPATIVDCNYLLPIVFRSFSLHTEEAACTLTWQSAVEIGLGSYVVEYSLDGKNFSELTTVSPKNFPSVYTYNTTLRATTYFRIRANDANSTHYSYSVVLKANFTLKGDQQNTTLQIQPTLVSNGVVQVVSSSIVTETGKFLVIDIAGRVVAQQAVTLTSGQNTTAVYLSGVSSGMYYLIYEGGKGKKKSLPFSVINN